MSKIQFSLLCAEALIAPEIALENEKICDALRALAPVEVIQDLLNSEF